MDIRERNRTVIEQFRAGEEIEGMHRDRILLLTTTGSKTGNPHTAPMMFHRDGDRLIVIASFAGAPKHPTWYNNLVADPRVTVEVDEETFQARASTATGEQRTRLWTTLTEKYPFLTEHQAKTDREIPLVVLTRV
jgi:deazaflavin-dependent oxidoreductase (nitroreductase family)